jgi:hypothetical protein
VVVGVERRQHHDHGWMAERGDASDGGQAVHTGHSQVHEHHIGPPPDD